LPTAQALQIAELSAPEAVANFPAAHLVHSDFCVVDMYVPPPQGWHSLWPPLAEIFPRGHALQSWPCRKFPAGHVLQMAALVAPRAELNVPAAQSRHLALLEACTPVAYLPAPHWVQLDAVLPATSMYVPSPHRAHPAPLRNDPTMQLYVHVVRDVPGPS